jgi:SpoVK/Ycf46/Vps4 family AAA+-type ATPase
LADELIQSLRAAVEASPSDVALRLHLAELLIERGERDEALRHLGRVLQENPGSERVLSLIAVAGAPDTAGEQADAGAEDITDDDPDAPPARFDFEERDREFEDVVPPMFADSSQETPTVEAWDVERETITLADVGGLVDVKERLELAFLAPLRNPELRKLYKKSLRGGLLLYGPPGCGKSFIARALAGELGAGFISVSISDVLNMFVGQSETNLHDLFMLARRDPPTVLFFDEVDALGRRRAQLSSDTLRTTVNQFLLELDGVEYDNEGVFVLAATNHPWDVDPALRRPGRFDRMLFVSPPDPDARAAIFRTNLAERPIEGVDLVSLAQRTEGFSGADIAHVCETAAEKALIDSARSGEARLIGMPDLEAALREVKPSISPWIETAKNVIAFANQAGDYDELRDYMKSRRVL